MCGSMVDPNLRRLRLGEGKKERRKKKQQGKNKMARKKERQDENIMSASATQVGHKNWRIIMENTMTKHDMLRIVSNRPVL